MKSKSVVLASVLKPVDEPRMFYKLAWSIYKLTGFSVKVIGFKGKNIPDIPIQQIPLFSFHPHSWHLRILAPGQFLLFLLRNKPDIIIICTHELLLPALVYRLFTKAQLVYDIQENYQLNLADNPHYPAWAKLPLSLLLRFRENLAFRYFDRFILAEKVYLNQLKTKGPNIVLENKALKSEYNKPKGRILLFSGTMAESTGVFEAINTFKLLKSVNPDWILHLCGFCATKSEWNTIARLINQMKDVKITGGTVHVPYSEITHAISEASLGFVHYKHQPSINGKVPTKIYEYLSCGLQILNFDYKECDDLIALYQPLLSIDRTSNGLPDLPSNDVLENIIKSPRKNSPDLLWQTDWESSTFPSWLQSKK